jgi:hypothetical protein
VKDEWREKQRELVAGEEWIVDRNNHATLDLRLERSEIEYTRLQPRVALDQRRPALPMVASRLTELQTTYDVTPSRRHAVVICASVVTATPEDIHTAVHELPNPNTAVSQAIASRFDGNVAGARRSAQLARRHVLARGRVRQEPRPGLPRAGLILDAGRAR